MVNLINLTQKVRRIIRFMLCDKIENDRQNDLYFNVNLYDKIGISTMLLYYVITKI